MKGLSTRKGVHGHDELTMVVNFRLDKKTCDQRLVLSPFIMSAGIDRDLPVPSSILDTDLYKADLILFSILPMDTELLSADHAASCTSSLSEHSCYLPLHKSQDFYLILPPMC